MKKFYITQSFLKRRKIMKKFKIQGISLLILMSPLAYAQTEDYSLPPKPSYNKFADAKALAQSLKNSTQSTANNLKHKIGIPDNSLESLFKTQKTQHIVQKLHKAGIKNVSQLRKLTKEEILSLSGIGAKTAKVIQTALRKKNPSSRIQKTKNSIVSKAQGTVGNVAKTTENLKETAKTGVKKAKKATQESIARSKDQAVSLAKSLKDKAKTPAKKSAQNTRNLRKNVNTGVKKVKEATQESIAQSKDQAVSLAKSLKDKAKTPAKKSTKNAQNLRKNVNTGVKKVKEATQESIARSKDQAVSLAKSLGNSTKSTVNNLKHKMRIPNNSLESLFKTQKTQHIIQKLHKAGINNVSQLRKLTKEEILSLPGIGAKTEKVIQIALRKKNPPNRIQKTRKSIVANTQGTVGKVAKTTENLKKTAKTGIEKAKETTQKIIDSSKSQTGTIAKSLENKAKNTAKKSTKNTRKLKKSTGTGVKKAKETTQKIIASSKSQTGTIAKSLEDKAKNTAKKSAQNIRKLKKSTGTGVKKAKETTQKIIASSKNQAGAIAKSLGNSTKSNVNNLKHKIGLPNNSLESLFKTQKTQSIIQKLHKAGVKNVSQLRKLTKEEILSLPGIGAKTAKIIQTALRKKNPPSRIQKTRKSIVANTQGTVKKCKEIFNAIKR